MTDVVGSTAPQERHSDAVGNALAVHDRLLDDLCARLAGSVLKRAGDRSFAVFPRVRDA